ncbi:MAG: nitroreductase [Desulfobacterales bacterium]|nr:MAG: nitroreductase [Desulfobacterales bacterium]
MNISEALTSRKSVRAFQDRDVEKEKIVKLLEAARYAPSGTNAQPWQVAVVQGEKRKKLTQAMEAAFSGKGEGEMDYQYYPTQWKEPYKRRRVHCGAGLYKLLGIDRKDRESRMKQWVANYRAFDAPVIMFFFLDPIMKTGSFLDYGMFIQSVMLAAMDQGLATCPQAALAQFPELVKKELGYENDTILVCGLAMGYEDKDAVVNTYRTTREEVEVFTNFFD